jgi:outer membrane protein assembly factor BamB
MPSRRPAIAIVLLGLAVASCGPAGTALTSMTPRVSPAAPSIHPSATPSAQPSHPPLSAFLPGAAAGFARTPDGVVFPGRLLIADRGNRRIVEITQDGMTTHIYPTASAPGVGVYGPWDDAFYTPDGSAIVANSEDTQTVIAVDRATGALRWLAGTLGRSGSGATRFHTPDDAVPGLDGTIWVADINNCRLVHLSADGVTVGTLGSGSCRHDPPRSFGHPNGAFPTQDGGLVVTEIDGSLVDRLGPDGTLLWSRHAPVRYPSDAMAYPDGTALLTDYSRPGSVVQLAPDGSTRWRYAPTGAAALDHPSIAVPLSSNRVAVCDDRGNRVIIVDPTTGAVLRTYDSAAGVGLRLPDGLAYWPATYP